MELVAPSLHGSGEGPIRHRTRADGRSRVAALLGQRDVGHQERHGHDGIARGLPHGEIEVHAREIRDRQRAGMAASPSHVPRIHEAAESSTCAIANTVPAAVAIAPTGRPIGPSMATPLARRLIGVTWSRSGYQARISSATITVPSAISNTAPFRWRFHRKHPISAAG